MRLLKHFIFGFLNFLSGFASQDTTRRLLIAAEKINPADHAYFRSLLKCPTNDQGSPEITACRIVCAATLIAPNLALTTAYCVADGVDLYLAEGNLFSASALTPERLITVSEHIENGFGKNARFPLDDDISILVLGRCLDLVAGVVGTLKVATSETGDTKACDSIELVGNGRSSIFAGPLFTDDHAIRTMSAKVHNSNICRDEFVLRAIGDYNISQVPPLSLSTLNASIIPDKYICSGGDSTSSICFGDSGSPLVKSGILVGIGSFLPSGECGLGPDYSTRVAFYAHWIAQVLRDNLCPNWSVENSFASWPIPPWQKSPEYLSTRCGEGQWQCFAQGGCIHDWQVCDGKIDCDDGSDEDSGLCSSPVVRRLQSDECTACELQIGPIESLVIEYRSSPDDGVINRMIAPCESYLNCLLKASCPPKPSDTIQICRDVGMFATATERHKRSADAFTSKYGSECLPSESSPHSSPDAKSFASLSGLHSIIIHLIIFMTL
jgi:hypothetical protein